MSMMKRFAEEISVEMGFDGELNDQVLEEAQRRLKEKLVKCPGCQRPEIHKLCPAWGTPLYMSGKLFTADDEKKYAAQHQAAVEQMEADHCKSGVVERLIWTKDELRVDFRDRDPDEHNWQPGEFKKDSITRNNLQYIQDLLDELMIGKDLHKDDITKD